MPSNLARSLRIMGRSIIRIARRTGGRIPCETHKNMFNTVQDEGQS